MSLIKEEVKSLRNFSQKLQTFITGKKFVMIKIGIDKLDYIKTILR